MIIEEDHEYKGHMKKVLVFIHIVYIFLIACGSVFSVGERTITLGGGETWRGAEYRTSITEERNIRPYPVLTLSSTAAAPVSIFPVIGSIPDLHVSFDERESRLFTDIIGNYRLTVSSGVEAADRRYARTGTGAALFGSSGAEFSSRPIIIQPQNTNALFASGNRLGDFSIEFWLYPQNMENGEQILSWAASGSQRITVTTSKNRLLWSFVNFFAPVNGINYLNIEFSGNTAIVPKTWSHHLIRFDASTGLIEYLVDGLTEAIVYATATGRENSQVNTPLIGNGGTFLLGERFSGLMDEFKVHRAFVGRSSIQKYQNNGGRIETRVIDLGENSSEVSRIDASGGRTSIRGPVVQNEFRENGRFRFSDDSEMNFFIRTSEDPFLLNNSAWTSFTPGAAISGVRGRYVQIAVDFYPSADGETSPYLEQLTVVYKAGEPPLPPRNVTATAVDGGVLLRWRNSPNAGAGYLVYYSDVRGEFFGTDALLGASPIDAGNRTSLFIDGLKNGTLYYFRIASYDRITGSVNYNIGEFSAEASARPLVGLLLSDILE